MQVLIINMAISEDRMAFQSRQMMQLALNFTRIDAITPSTLSPAPDHKIWRSWQRPLKEGEKALLASHIKAWHHVVELNKPCLILEDDALLSGDVRDFLGLSTELEETDLISLETRARKKIVGQHAHPKAPIVELFQDRTGSAAYILWPRGAQKLLHKSKTRAAPSDAFITSTYTLKAYQADPALAIQLDHCDYYNVTQPLEGTSILANETKVDRSQFNPITRIMFRLKRVAGQLRMGLRQLQHLRHSQKRHIEPSPQIGSHLT